MLEDFEGLSEMTRKTGDTLDVLSSAQSDYLNECIETNNAEALIDRIDEMSSYQPPKAIDNNTEISEMIEPLKDTIDTKYLEAPGDLEQIKQIGDYLSDVDELKYENWQSLSPEERYEVLVKAEFKIAEIEHREFCEIKIKELPEGHYGFYSPDDKSITINSRYLTADDFNSYKETLDTLIHEGRHAYQDYNMTEREVHPRSGEVNMWKWNEYGAGYLSPELYGYEIYSVQAVEADAKAFAEDVLTSYLNKTA